MRGCAVSATMLSVILLAGGCNGAMQPGEDHSLRIVDADTREPLGDCVGISLVAKTAWHRWSDPDESAFQDWHVVKVQLMRGEHARLWLAEYSPGHGSLFFLVQQERRGNVIFARGYVPGLYEYLGSQFYATYSEMRASPVAKRSTYEGNSLTEFPMVPLGNDKYGRAKPDARTLQRRQDKLAFLLGQDAMWNDLAEHYRAGRDKEAIKLACDSVMLTLESLTLEDKAAATREHPRVVEWCLQVSNGVR